MNSNPLDPLHSLQIAGGNLGVLQRLSGGHRVEGFLGEAIGPYESKSGPSARAVQVRSLGSERRPLVAGWEGRVLVPPPPFSPRRGNK